MTTRLLVGRNTLCQLANGDVSTKCHPSRLVDSAGPDQS